MQAQRFNPATRGRRIYLGLAFGLGLALTLLFGAVAAAGPAAGPQPPANPAATAHGDVIVQFGDDDTAARAITFTAGISGLEALGLAGLHVVTTTTQYGTAVCSIEGVGCPAENCFTCAGGRYWGYNYWASGAWQSYPVGPDGSVLNDGAVEGWRWGNYGDAMTAPEPVTAALKALDWLRARQSATDGGYDVGGLGDSGTVEALLAIAANHYSAASWRRAPGAPSIASYQMGQARLFTHYGAGEAGKYTVAQVAGGACWPYSALTPASYYHPDTGVYMEGALPQTWAMLGTVALSQTVPAPAVAYLKSLVQPDGGWAWGLGANPDTNTTALVVQALIATGEPPTSTLISRALSFVKTYQNSDGGFGSDPLSLSSDADSTAYVVQAILAAGQSPITGTWRIGAANPISYLLSLQLPDGSFEWQKGKGPNPLATEQAISALLSRTFPLAVARPADCLRTDLPVVKKP